MFGSVCSGDKVRTFDAHKEVDSIQDTESKSITAERNGEPDTTVKVIKLLMRDKLIYQ